MRRINFPMTLACVCLLAAPSAFAHRLIDDDGSHTSAENAIVIDDVDLSQVIYHEVTASSNHLWTTFTAQAGDNLYWQLGLPAIDGLEDYRPTLVILGPGLPPVAVPFTVPDGLGGIVIDTESTPTTFFYERFTGTDTWIIDEEDRTLTQGGQYYVVAYHPDGTPGKFFLAIGRREEFGLTDILTYEDVMTFVREYHEVSDKPLPVIPWLLLLVSRIANAIQGLLGLF
jgi:hypothetical protein